MGSCIRKSQREEAYADRAGRFSDVKHKKKTKAELQLDIKQRDEEIKQKNKDIKQRDEYISYMKKAKDQQDQSISDYRRDLKHNERTIQSLKKGVEQKDSEISLLQTNASQKNKVNKDLENKVRNYERTLAKQDEDIKILKKKNEEMLIRLSAMAGANLTDGNANIADLSDENRPTRLAEQFSELYDNEWTDAFGLMTHSGKVTEKEACTILLNMLYIIYDACRQKASNEMTVLVSSFNNFTGEEELPKDILNTLKDKRKKRCKDHSASLMESEKIMQSLNKLLPEQNDRQAVKPFLDKSLQICWLMVVQDPPVHIDTVTPRRNVRFNSNTHKLYTRSGTFVDFVVWPTLYLCEGGGILSKGVAQCKSALEPTVCETKVTTESDTYVPPDSKGEPVYINDPRKTPVVNISINKSMQRSGLLPDLPSHELEQKPPNGERKQETQKTFIPAQKTIIQTPK